jgi:hypothetical protein
MQFLKKKKKKLRASDGLMGSGGSQILKNMAFIQPLNVCLTMDAPH